MPTGGAATDGLLPSVAPSGSVRVDRELPTVALQWGRVLDTSALWPGDLILTRPVDPKADSVSWRIQRAQEARLDRRHAQWTHAAVYLGDGENICEANFKVRGFRYGVIVRSIHAYCDGEYAIRARRPIVPNAQARMGIAVGALVNLNKGYSFLQALQFAYAAYTGKGLWQAGAPGPRMITHAVVCSTLYQDALAFMEQGSKARIGSMLTPAHLSAASDFEPVDPLLRWLSITE
jgi:hypothetical protein